MSAVISDCGRYRYRLDRPHVFGDLTTAVVMVNPSTADATTNDATIRKLLGFRDRHTIGNIVVGNLFAYRATDVHELGRQSDPVGPENDTHLARMFEEADQVLVAWGPLAKQPRYHRGRWRDVMALVPAGKPVVSIGAPCKDGHPRHPLMLAYAEPLTEWKEP